MINPPTMSKTLWFIVAVVTLLVTQTDAQDPQYLNIFCNTNETHSGNYSLGSPYQNHLNQILDTLIPYSSSNSFYSYTQGSGSDQIWTLFSCRYDYTLEECHACVQAAATKALNLCPVQKEAVIFYLQCTLRYANRDIFSVEEVDPVAWRFTTNNATMNFTGFSKILDDNLATAIPQTANDASLSPRYFKTLTVANISSDRTLYLLLQCTPDLTPAGCDKCLRTSVADMPPVADMDFLVMFEPSCQMAYGLNLFFRVPAPAPSPLPDSRRTRKSGVMYTKVVIPAAVAGVLIIIAIWLCLIRKRLTLTKLSGRKALRRKATRDQIDVEAGLESTDCIQFDLKMIEGATNGFSPLNKLGEGGFGIVYQGTLENGQRVAVKRLSNGSGQGAQEFKTEVAVVAKLQHRNLVRLVGFCVEEEEQLLVYEFMPNLSLERFLFDSTRSTFLTWEIRNKIIVGIARGLHYLHEDSRVKIVHRDLKISNILLDDDLDPKIADFGLARLVKVDQTTTNTVRVVGTYGYMAPEYALAGRFSTKSDVYSYGVMILEILSGRSINRFYESSHGEGLLRHAWRVWDEGKVEQLIDPTLHKNYSKAEAGRRLQIGLLCVQDDEDSRPTMHAVLVMLNNDSSELPTPFSPSLVSKNMPDSDATDYRNTPTMNLQSDFSRTSDTWSPGHSGEQHVVA